MQEYADPDEWEHKDTEATIQEWDEELGEYWLACAKAGHGFGDERGGQNQSAGFDE